MTRWIDRYCRLLEILIALMLAAMVLLVFGNVVLRYGFNSGITVSEELSRWLFVWLTFLGAIVALHGNDHLGSDMLVSRLSVRGKKVCLVAGQLLMLLLCGLMFMGSLQQTRISWDVEAPVTGASMAWLSGVGMVFAASAAVILLMQLGRVLSGRITEAELVMVKESEEAGELEALQAELAHEKAAVPATVNTHPGSKA